MTTVAPVVADPWVTQAQDDVIGAIVQSPRIARVVNELVDPADLSPRHLRLVGAALDVPEDPDAQLDGLDDGDGLGPVLLVAGNALVEPDLLARILWVADATGESVMQLAQWVVQLGCSPCRSCVTEMATEIHDAARHRRAGAQLAGWERRLADGDVEVLELLEGVA